MFPHVEAVGAGHAGEAGMVFQLGELALGAFGIDHFGHAPLIGLERRGGPRSPRGEHEHHGVPWAGMSRHMCPLS